MARPVTGNFATDFSDVLGGLADLAWPVVAVVALVMFKQEIAGLFQRIRRAKTPVGDFELEQALDRAKASTDRASETVPEQPAALPSAPRHTKSAPAKARRGDDDEELEESQESEDFDDLEDLDDLEGLDDVRDHRLFARRHFSRQAWPWAQALDSRDYILAEAARSPRVALIALSAEIERRSREVLASSQDPSAWRSASLSQKLTRLDLAPSVREAAKEFQNVRNRIVHGHDATDEDALRAIDIGLELLSAIDRITHEVHYVVEPHVEVFADENGETPYTDFHGVLLESVAQTPRQGERHGQSIRHAFPTTRSHFKKGKPVSWEWERGRVYPEAWYRAPEDGEIKYGWTSALEFVGRPLEDL